MIHWLTKDKGIIRFVEDDVLEDELDTQLRDVSAVDRLAQAGDDELWIER